MPDHEACEPCAPASPIGAVAEERRLTERERNMLKEDTNRTNGSVLHEFDCTHDPCRCLEQTTADAMEARFQVSPAVMPAAEVETRARPVQARTSRASLRGSCSD